MVNMQAKICNAPLKISIILCLACSRQVETGFTDYFRGIGTYFQANQDSEITDLNDDYIPRVPYEVSAPDEKFISEAQKLTGVALSELDSCQQRVVLKLQSDCDKMNDEQVAKMAVHLLNCQSYVEGRSIFPCTDDMSIKDCTTKMDSDTWTSYHLMSNRAKAVCYSIRQIQFRGLAEHTVNRLMDTAKHQLKTLGQITKNQEDLQDIAEFTLNSISKGHDVLSEQQKSIQKAQFHGQLALEDNIRKLSKEKELILEAHNYLIDMTQKIQHKLENSANQLEHQTKESHSNHQELIDDLVAIQNKAHLIFERIDESSKLLLKQNEDFQDQYESTLRNLAEVNRTVHSLVNLVGGTRQVLEERLNWLTAALGGTDLAVERLYLIVWHSAFMMVSMLTCAFLSARLSTRFVVATIPPINLALALWGEERQLGPLELGGVILAFVLGQLLLLYALSYKKEIRGALQWPTTNHKAENQPQSAKINSSSSSYPTTSTNGTTKTTTNHYEYKSSKYYATESADDNEVNVENSDDDNRSEVDAFNQDAMGSPTPPLSRSGYYSNSSRLSSRASRSNTPLTLNTSTGRGICHAKTRVGTPCKLSSLAGRDFCYRHQSGDSVMS